MSHIINIDDSTCVGCGACTKACFFKRIEVTSEGKAKINEDKPCFGCGHCASACPTLSISFDGRKPVKLEVLDGIGEIAKALVMKRRSVRNFKPEPIPRSILENILDTASANCPSGCNMRKCYCTMITGRPNLDLIVDRTIGKLGELGDPMVGFMAEERKKGLDPITYGAPHLLVVWQPDVKPFFGGGKTVVKRPANLEAGILMETIELLLVANGFGSIFIGFITGFGIDEELKKLLHVPEDADPLMCLAVGKPNEIYPNTTPRQPHPTIFVE